jgi:V8-like Glu-specific endopeptidase
MPSRISQVLPSCRVALWCVLAASLLAGSALTLPVGAQSERSERSSPGSDRARSIQDTSRYPWSCICKIIATFPDDTTMEGSGTMIGRHHCLTALHLLYNKKTKTAAKRVVIIPGYDDERLLALGINSHPAGNTHVNQFLFWEPHDVAIIVTSANIGDESSWLTVDSRSDRDLLSQTYMLAGYPDSARYVERQHMLTTNITYVEGDRIRLSRDSPEGMIGGPIFERGPRGRTGEHDTWSIIGIQTGRNRGTRIPSDMRRILDRFLRDDFSGVNADIPLPRR